MRPSYPATWRTRWEIGHFLQTTGNVFNHGFAILTLADSFGQADYYAIPGDGSNYVTPLRPVFSENLWRAGEAAAAHGG